MKIARVEAIQLANIPTAPPPFREELRTERLGILELETDDGCVGYGILRSDPDGFIEHQAADFLKGKDPLLTDELWQQLLNRFVRGRDVSRHVADLAAIDVAMWDLKGKALGLPVWRLLGGAQNRVQAYVSFGLAGPNTSAGWASPTRSTSWHRKPGTWSTRGTPSSRPGSGGPTRLIPTRTRRAWRPCAKSSARAGRS